MFSKIPTTEEEALAALATKDENETKFRHELYRRYRAAGQDVTPSFFATVVKFADVQRSLHRLAASFAPFEGTIQEMVEARLSSHGLSSSEITTVIVMMKDHPSSTDFALQWPKPAIEENRRIFAVLCYFAVQIAREWLKANKPEHFALALLDS